LGNCTVSLDNTAFAGEESGGRVQQRGQRVIRGTLTASSSHAADSGGDSCDLSSYFPAGKYRVILNPVSNTGNRLGLYDADNKKLLVFTSLGTEAGASDQSTNGIFSFIAIGE